MCSVSIHKYLKFKMSTNWREQQHNDKQDWKVNHDEPYISARDNELCVTFWLSRI
jgi:hypothetical protein